MTIERQDILEDFYVGNHKNIRSTVYDKDGNVFDLTNGEVTFYLFDEVTGENYITKSSAYPAEAAIIDAVNGKCVVYLVPNDTLRRNDENLYGTFRYHIHAVDQNENGEIVTSGRINIFKTPATGRARKDTLAAYLLAQPVP